VHDHGLGFVVVNYLQVGDETREILFHGRMENKIRYFEVRYKCSQTFLYSF
jgi:hypothetical protein